MVIQQGENKPEAVILIGIQATGKSTFYQSCFVNTHIRINLDMLKTRNREKILIEACMEAKQSFVIDNTNPTRKERARYVSFAKAAGFKIIGYYFHSSVKESLLRNENRENGTVPDIAIRATSSKLELPAWDEGFDELYYVKQSGDKKFIVEPYQEDSPHEV
jgi:predicted kinase